MHHTMKLPNQEVMFLHQSTGQMKEKKVNFNTGFDMSLIGVANGKFETLGDGETILSLNCAS